MLGFTPSLGLLRFAAVVGLSYSTCVTVGLVHNHASCITLRFFFSHWHNSVRDEGPVIPAGLLPDSTTDGLRDLFLPRHLSSIFHLLIFHPWPSTHYNDDNHNTAAPRVGSSLSLVDKTTHCERGGPAVSSPSLPSRKERRPLSLPLRVIRAILAFIAGFRAVFLLSPSPSTPSTLPEDSRMAVRWQPSPFPRVGMVVRCGSEGHGAVVLDMPLEWRDGLICDRAFLVFVPLLGSGRIQPSVLGYSNALVCALTSSRRAFH